MISWFFGTTKVQFFVEFSNPVNSILKSRILWILGLNSKFKSVYLLQKVKTKETN